MGRYFIIVVFLSLFFLTVKSERDDEISSTGKFFYAQVKFSAVSDNQVND